MENKIIMQENTIKEKIYTVRGMQVMVDSDLAMLYDVETKQLNKAVNRNLDRFPEKFRFQLNQDEYENLRFHFGTSSSVSQSQHGGRRYLPYVFTEQGVSMLSAVLRSKTAIEVSIKIIDSFVNMRKFLSNNALVFNKIDYIEQKLLKHDEKFDEIFEAIEAKEIKPKQGIFFDGEIFDAYLFIDKLIKKAKKSITLIDNYIDETVLLQLSSDAQQDVKITILTKTITKKLELDIQKHNAQYKTIKIKKFTLSHDRFLIIDEKEIYHIGASLKDLGKKWFAFSLMDENSFAFLNKINKVINE